MKKSVDNKKLHNREYPFDTEFPYKITCPKFSLTPLRFDSLFLANRQFESLKKAGYKAIYTLTEIQTRGRVVTRYLGFNLPDNKRKE